MTLAPYALLAAALACGCSAAPRAPRAQEHDLPEDSVSVQDGLPPAHAAEGEPDVVDYFARRGFDLLDVFSMRVAAGPGILVHARATKFVALGSGHLGPVTTWDKGFTMEHYQLGWLRREGGAWTERRAEAGLSTFYYYEVEARPLAGNRHTFGPDSRGTFDVGAELHLALIGLGAEVRPDEVFDFVTGIVGFDLLDDDAPPPIDPVP